MLAETVTEAPPAAGETLVVKQAIGTSCESQTVTESNEVDSKPCTVTSKFKVLDRATLVGRLIPVIVVMTTLLTQVKLHVSVTTTDPISADPTMDHIPSTDEGSVVGDGILNSMEA